MHINIEKLGKLIDDYGKLRHIQGQCGADEGLDKAHKAIVDYHSQEVAAAETIEGVLVDEIVTKLKEQLLPAVRSTHTLGTVQARNLLTKKQLLAMALSVEVQHAKKNLVLLKGVTALAKAVAAEKANTIDTSKEQYHE